MLLHEGDDVERLEVGQPHGELCEALARRGRVDNNDCQAPDGRRGSHEDFERAVAVLREQGEGDALHGTRSNYLGATLSVQPKNGAGSLGWTEHVPRHGCPGRHVSSGSSRGGERRWWEREGIRSIWGGRVWARERVVIA
jgi:hypothetical protein